MNYITTNIEIKLKLSIPILLRVKSRIRDFATKGKIGIIKITPASIFTF